MSDPATPSPPTYWLTRFAILRLVGFVYLMAFLVAARQSAPLFGHDGLTPADLYLDRLVEQAGSRAGAFFRLPTVFLLIGVSDGALAAVAWIGVALSALAVAGFSNAILMALLWAHYMSIVHVGQIWYGYGWEIQLLETGFLAIFLCPLLDPRPLPRRPPPVAVLWLFRWLAFRIMLGAGLIKIRGDACWRDLTCLTTHYETQPIPNPLSRALHFMPVWFHKAGVLFNHLVELVAPWLAFWPRIARHVAGTLMVAYQIILIISGNLSFLNWLTIVPALACFDDSLLRRIVPGFLARRAERAAGEWAAGAGPANAAAAGPSRLQFTTSMALVAVVAFLSIGPVLNLVSSRQAMNTSFDRLHLVNTYGAFGSVGRQRPELVFEGTSDDTITPGTEWKEYEFYCKPGDPRRRPCQISPYHYRLDWQIWFAAMAGPDRYPWTVHFAWKLLHGDPGALGLLADNPFPDAPPRAIRVVRYIYEFAPPDDPEGRWWIRSDPHDWLPPLRADDPRLRRFLASYGWIGRDR
jgi:hypothetical protein